MELKQSPLPFSKPGAMSRDNSAQYLGISTRSLDELRKSGEVKAIEVAGKIVIRTEELDRYLAEK